MGLCFVPGCDHKHPSHCKMFKMPKDSKTFKLWTRNLACRSDRKPSYTSIVCSCHFKEGKKENGPTIFPHNLKKHDFSSPEKRRRVQTAADKPSCSKDPDPVLLETDTLEEPENPSLFPLTDFRHDDSLELQMLRKKIVDLENELKTAKCSFSYDRINSNDELIYLYTGLPNDTIFSSLAKYIKTISIKYYLGWNVVKFSVEDQLLVTLMKLRLNVPHLDIATRFGCGSATITNIFITFVHILHKILFKKFMNNIPSQTKTKTCLPNSFSRFTNCRIIIDCTEIRIAIPMSMKDQKETYSNYKHFNTYKGLVGVAPNGVITFVSNLYPGSTSDKQIFSHCGLREQLKAGDMIMADKGFLINDLLPPGVHVNIPPFLMTPQFSEEQSRHAFHIARARIHVERANSRIKRFRILHFIPSTIKPLSSIVFQVCCSLVNLQNPLIKETEELLQ